MNFKKGDLVMIVKKHNFSEHPEGGGILSVSPEKKFKIWLKVVFIDNDNTFVGTVEKHEKNKWTGDDVFIHQVGSHIKCDSSDVIKVYNGEQWCYSDDTLTCRCPGLCREK